MQITITGRNLDIDGALKAYMNKKMEKLERLYARIFRCEVILGEEKTRKIAEIVLHLKRNRVVAKESSTDMYASIDNAAESIKKQLRKLRGRVHSRRRKAVLSRVMTPVYFFNKREDIEEKASPGIIIKTNLFAEKPMLPYEAQLEIDLTDKQFIMFKNSDTGKANVLYKKSDGNYGVIEPNF
ncbi:MAG: ribosome-associated translation inhibitor RaiA [Candidatus Omnitrophota bacterium]|nr:ribosome-associated translation inhibitor RaiA [Candidatus Omnitrophota bacterium]